MSLQRPVDQGKDSRQTTINHDTEMIESEEIHNVPPFQTFTSTSDHRQRLVRQFTRSTTIHNVQDEPIEAAAVDKTSVLCGLAAGMVQAGLFSPYDRALYRSITNGTPFLSLENFRNPFSGFSQSIGGRALSGGIYFPLEQFFFRLFHPENDNVNRRGQQQSQIQQNSKWRNLGAGTAAGALNAMILNPLSAVKYKTWSRMYNRGMFAEAISMLRKGGRGVFYKGLTSTLLRDVSFGGCYTFIRLQIQWAWSLHHEHQWMANLLAAALATVVSGPFNLARSIQYSTKSEQSAPTTYEVLEQFVLETQQKESLQSKWLYVTRRLRIGWGTARVATGMAFGHWVYDGLHCVLHDENSWPSSKIQKERR